jgi:hypothetical protein
MGFGSIDGQLHVYRPRRQKTVLRLSQLGGLFSGCQGCGLRMNGRFAPVAAVQMLWNTSEDGIKQTASPSTAITLMMMFPLRSSLMQRRAVPPSPPRSASSEMSNKIAQVLLDFSGAARMCAGTKE